MDEYHVIQIAKNKYKYSLFKKGNQRCTRTFEDGLELQQYIGWLVLNRPCRIITHNSNGEGLKEIDSLNFINFLKEKTDASQS